METERKTISSPLPPPPVEDASDSKIAPDSSSPGLFRSVFPPASTVLGKDSPKPDFFGSLKNVEGGLRFPDTTSPEKKSATEIDGCLFGESVYYGGKDDCDIPSRSPSDTRYQFQYEKKDADSGEEISGEWWQGSYYY